MHTVASIRLLGHCQHSQLRRALHPLTLQTRQVLELLAAHLAGWACSAGFPELAHVPLLRLRRFAAGTPVERFRSAARGLAAALEANAGFVAAARARAGAAPADARALQGFLAAEDAAQAVRLCTCFHGLGSHLQAGQQCLLCTLAGNTTMLDKIEGGAGAGAAAEVCGAAGGEGARAAGPAGR